MYDDIKNPDVSDQLGHVRSLLGLSRAMLKHSKYSIALDHLQKAAALAEKYETFTDGNYYIGMIFEFQAEVYFQLGEEGQAEKALAISEKCEKEPRHFIPGLGTYVREELASLLSKRPSTHNRERHTSHYLSNILTLSSSFVIAIQFQPPICF